MMIKQTIVAVLLLLATTGPAVAGTAVGTGPKMSIRAAIPMQAIVTHRTHTEFDGKEGTFHSNAPVTVKVEHDEQVSWAQPNDENVYSVAHVITKNAKGPTVVTIMPAY